MFLATSGNVPESDHIGVIVFDAHNSYGCGCCDTGSNTESMNYYVFDPAQTEELHKFILELELKQTTYIVLRGSKPMKVNVQIVLE